MKVKTTVHIHYFKFDWDAEGRFEVLSFKADDDNYRTYIGQQEIEIEVPDDYDPRAQQIVALEKQKQKVMADYQKTVTEINNRINKLQALEYSNE
jgi:hypothetical protein